MARCRKPSYGPHYGRVQNPISRFTDAYAFVKSNPGKIYSTPKGTKFKASATYSQSKDRKGWKVIKFDTGKSTAAAYKPCWGRMTNISGVHIHMYTSMIK